MVFQIRKSCITGRWVWIYRAPTKHAANQAYRRAWTEELKREKALPGYAREMARRILHIKNECVADLDITTPLTPEQRSACRDLAKYAAQTPPTGSEFREHVFEEQRRRAEDKEIRRQMRERMKKNNNG